MSEENVKPTASAVTPDLDQPLFEEDPTSPYAGLNSKKLHDAALRALDHYLAPPKPPKASQRPSTIFVIAPNVDAESLLVHSCETLASANVMASELAHALTGSQSNLVLAIQQMISLAELSVNRVLDEWPLHKA